MTDLDAVRNCFTKNDIGIIFYTKQIKTLVNIKYGKKPGNIIPSDYCYNITNNGIKNYETYLHIFISKGTGQYKYVGENYKYNGKVTNKGITIGEWIEGKFYSDSRERDNIKNKVEIISENKSNQPHQHSSKQHGRNTRLLSKHYRM